MQGIYIIYFDGEEKVYIGESSNIFDRWNRHVYDLKNNKHHSNKLQLIYNKGLHPLFEVLVEEANETSRKELEVVYIKEFDSYYNGFNCTTGVSVVGSGHSSVNAIYTKEQYASIVNELAYSSASQKDIASKLGVSINIVNNLASLRRHTWIEEEMPLEYELILLKQSIVVPRGDHSNIEEAFKQIVLTKKPINIISEECAVTLHQLRHLLNQESHKWLKVKYPKEYESMLLNKGLLREVTCTGKYSVVCPAGKIYQFSNQKHFAKEHNLNPGNLNGLIKGYRKSCSGWTLYNANTNT